MLVTCPNCSSRYQVPDQVVGMKGRIMRCARCEHQWKQPFVASQPEARAKRPEARMVTDPPRERRPEPVMITEEREMAEEDESPIEDDLLAAAMRQEETGEEMPDEMGGEGEEGGNPFDKIAQMMMEQPPAPIPDMFANPPAARERRRRGALGLILLSLIIIVVAAAGLAYLFQDRIINRYPVAAAYYEKLGVRNEIVGAGLELREVTSERTTANGAEVLLVRGVIGNTTEHPHHIPSMRLTLLDGKDTVQEKTVDPPQATIDAKGTVGFKISLDQPDPNATRFEVTFASAKSGGGADKGGEKPAEPAK